MGLRSAYAVFYLDSVQADFSDSKFWNRLVISQLTDLVEVLKRNGQVITRIAKMWISLLSLLRSWIV